MRYKITHAQPHGRSMTFASPFAAGVGVCSELCSISAVRIVLVWFLRAVRRSVPAPAGLTVGALTLKGDCRSPTVLEELGSAAAAGWRSDRLRGRSAPEKIPPPCSRAPVTIRSKRPLDADAVCSRSRFRRLGFVVSPRAAYLLASHNSGYLWSGLGVPVRTKLVPCRTGE